jgi:hypothetical protein
MNPATYYLSSLNRKGVLLYAYSLRRIVPNYTGFAIQVRRGTSGTLQEFSFDPITGQLDQSAILSFVGANQVGYVSKWYDQSGNGNTLGVSGVVAGREPRIVNSGSPSGTIVTKNGKIALSWGVSAFNVLKSVNTLTKDVDNLSLFVVCSNTNFTNLQAGVSVMDSANAPELVIPRADSGGDYYWYNGSNQIFLGVTSADNKVYSSLSTLNTIASWKNNVQSISSPLINVPNTAIGKQIVLGNNGFSGFQASAGFVGTMQEVLVYEGNPNGRNYITSEMMSYYSIT